MLMKAIMNTPLGMKNVVENPITYKFVMSAVSQCGVGSEIGQTGKQQNTQINLMK